MIVYLNGDYIEESTARVSVNDRGFIFGDGIYEVMRVIGGHLFEAAAHLKRLREGLAALRIDAGLTDRDILQISDKLIRENDLRQGEAMVYMQITRGAAVRTHEFPTPAVAPTVYFSARRFVPNPDLLKNGAAAITLPDLRWACCNLKTVNLLPNVLAKQQAHDAGVHSAIFIRDGFVTEAPSANVFVVKDGILRTFPATNFILHGITRQVLLTLAAELAIPVDTRPLPADQLFQMDEVFMSGTTTDVQAITRIDGKSIGTGRPGPVTTTLLKALRKRMDSMATRGSADD